MIFFDVIIYKPGRNSVVPSLNYQIHFESLKKLKKLQTLKRKIQEEIDQKIKLIFCLG